MELEVCGDYLLCSAPIVPAAQGMSCCHIHIVAHQMYEQAVCSPSAAA